MLGQEESDLDFLLIEKGTDIWMEEEDIDSSQPLYLITWSPNPSELPNADFTTQHLYFVNLLSGYLKTCYTGLFCVETTQMGNPHYHGWYQVSPDPNYEKARIVYTKTLIRFGNMKITKSKGIYRINSYSTRSNCLGYYKKDLLDPMLWCNPNPITAHSQCNIDWAKNMLYFVREGKSKIADLEEKINLKEFYLQFYENSDVSRIG